MINRIFARSKSNFNSRNSERPFNFTLKQQLAFDAEMDQQLLDLERRFTSDQCAICFAQQQLNTAASATDGSDGASEPCTYDDFGLVEGLELDVNWM